MRFKKIYIEITNICNMQCSFCPPTNRLKKEMSVEQFEQVLKQIKPFTSYVYLHLRGEPLLHSHFSEILKLCEKYNIKVNITTNGYFLKKYINIIKDSLIINQINISLHAYDSENEIIELIEVIENIRNNQANIVIRHWVSDKKDKSFLMLNDILNNKYSVEILDSKNVKLDNKLFFNIDKEFTWPTLNNNVNCKQGFCYGLKTHIGILSDGTVVPCCLDAEGIIKLGNIFEENLESILKNERTQNMINNFRNNNRIEELCKHCDFKNLF